MKRPGFVSEGADRHEERLYAQYLSFQNDLARVRELWAERHKWRVLGAWCFCGSKMDHGRKWRRDGRMEMRLLVRRIHSDMNNERFFPTLRNRMCPPREAK